MSNTPNPGDLVQTMLVGHVVNARVVSVEDRGGDLTFHCVFVSHHPSGSTRLCLDFGAGRNIAAGEKFTCSAANIARAAQGFYL